LGSVDRRIMIHDQHEPRKGKTKRIRETLSQRTNQGWWYTPVFQARQEGEVEGLQSNDEPKQKHETLC
jgi:hypothetical protein